MKLKRITVEGFKCLKNIDIEMRDLMVLIGPNGAGKTSFIEVFSLLKDVALGRLADSLSEKGGINDILYKENPERFFNVKVVTNETLSNTDNRPLFYFFEVASSGIGYEISSERLVKRSGDNDENQVILFASKNGESVYLDIEKNSLLKPVWAVKKYETLLSQRPFTLFNEPDIFSLMLQGIRYYGSLDVSRRSPVRMPQELSPQEFPGPNGEHLIAALYNMRTNHADNYERLLDTMRVAFPGFRKLEFPLVGSGQAAIAWYEESFDKPLYAHQLSEGMLRFLWLSTILLSPNPPFPSVTLIDEPEVSLHPDSLKVLAELLQEASLETQLIVATHSNVLVGFLKPEHVVAVRRDHTNGSSSFHWGDTFDLDRWLEKYTLGELMLMKEIE